MKKLFLIFGLVLAMATSVHAVDSTCLQDHADHGGFNIITMTWTTSDAGAFTATTTSWPINGMVIQVDTNPDGTAVPTAAYDLVLNDSGGADIMGGNIADRSATDTEIVKPALGSVGVQGYLTLGVSNAGNSKTGVVKIFYYSAN